MKPMFHNDSCSSQRPNWTRVTRLKPLRTGTFINLNKFQNLDLVKTVFLVARLKMFSHLLIEVKDFYFLIAKRAENGKIY